MLSRKSSKSFVGDETGFVQVASTAITRGMIVLVLTRVLVSQNEPVTEVNLECIGLFMKLIFKDGSSSRPVRTNDI